MAHRPRWRGSPSQRQHPGCHHGGCVTPVKTGEAKETHVRGSEQRYRNTCLGGPTSPSRCPTPWPRKQQERHFHRRPRHCCRVCVNAMGREQWGIHCGADVDGDNAEWRGRRSPPHCLPVHSRSPVVANTTSRWQNHCGGSALPPLHRSLEPRWRNVRHPKSSLFGRF